MKELYENSFNIFILILVPHRVGNQYPPIHKQWITEDFPSRLLYHNCLKDDVQYKFTFEIQIC